MREIKFRGKYEYSEENIGWIYGLLVKDSDGDVYIFPDGGTHCTQGDWWFDYGGYGLPCVDPETVGQLTGLRDINGKDIYEGDIIRQDVCGDGSNGVVVYDEEHAMFALRYYDPHNPVIYGLYDCQEKELEILGNIHDNPELLKQTTN